jgi:hypothetical protein
MIVSRACDKITVEVGLHHERQHQEFSPVDASIFARAISGLSVVRKLGKSRIFSAIAMSGNRLQTGRIDTNATQNLFVVGYS